MIFGPGVFNFKSPHAIPSNPSKIKADYKSVVLAKFHLNDTHIATLIKIQCLPIYFVPFQYTYIHHE